MHMNELMKGERKFCFEYELSGWNDSGVKNEKRKPRKPLEEYGGCAAAVMLPFGLIRASS